jgi:hypothetical protein
MNKCTCRQSDPFLMLNDHCPEHGKREPQQIVFEPPKMSWDEPIEEEILKFVRSMKQQWQTQVRGNIWRSVNKAAENYVNAYETVEKHILREIDFRKKIK